MQLRLGYALRGRPCQTVALYLLLASPALGAFEVVGAGLSITATRGAHHRVYTWPLAGRGPVRPLHAYFMRIAIEVARADLALTGERHS
jgi:hypothetical protein